MRKVTTWWYQRERESISGDYLVVPEEERGEREGEEVERG